MNSATRSSLWRAFGALFLFVVISAAMNIYVLNRQRDESERTRESAEPLMRAIMRMDAQIGNILSAARAYSLSRRTEFVEQYDRGIQEFGTTAARAEELASQPQDRRIVRDMVQHMESLRRLTDEQIRYTNANDDAAAREAMIEVARARRTASDFAAEFYEREEIRRARVWQKADQERLKLVIILVMVSGAIVLFGIFTVLRVERSLEESIARQVRRTETIVAGMADGIMLTDGDGRVVFINSAGKNLLKSSTIGVPIEQQATVYGLRSPEGAMLETSDVPAAQALSRGRAAEDVTVMIDHGDGRQITVSMNAVPLHEDNRVSGVIVTFRDITERRRLEEETQLQAERAQILAEAGAFFASNIDPVWVTQAIVERVAEVLGDWAAIILKEPESNDLRVASLYHRDMTSLGLAWSFVYRQPLVLGEGVFGQVISSGYPSLMSNLEPAGSRDNSGYFIAPMKLASLLVLPLRTRREIVGAMVIAANDPDRQMDDQKLPLAELLAERAAVAIENARLYTEQVEARKKVEDLSRLKDEFLSIASHELRTPVTSIKGYTQLAKALIHENDLKTSEEYLSVALDQIDRMSRLILELLDVSRIETGRLEIRRESIEWFSFVNGVVARHHTSAHDRKFHLEMPPNASRNVDGDRDRLEQVLGNLLENAVKYSPDGSDVSVKVRDEEDRVVTSISDSGIGIPSDELAQVFERFHRGRQVSATNYGGLGLGLYISKQIVDRHGGNIWVESREGQGTTFHFSLPAA
jgi:signal transduction histidine kinase/CHASE3 domain sensor protein